MSSVGTYSSTTLQVTIDSEPCGIVKRHPSSLAVAEVIRRRQLVPVVFSTHITNKAADGFQSLVPLGNRRGLTGPFDGGCNTHMGFTTSRGKTGKAPQ